MSAAYSVKILNKENRKSFDCGVAALNDYFIKRASQDMRRRIATCFIAIDNHSGEIAGYYTLSASELDFTCLDEAMAKKLPRYPTIPAVRLGRLAIDLSHQGKKLGAALLADAVKRMLQSEIAAHFLIVDAKDEKAANFYRYHGFQNDPDMPHFLYASLLTLARAIESP